MLRFLAALLVAFMAIRATGFEWLACGECEAHSEAGLADVDDPCSEVPCGPQCTDCGCCFNQNYPVPPMIAGQLAPDPVVPMPALEPSRIVPPEPREILHVPKSIARA